MKQEILEMKTTYELERNSKITKMLVVAVVILAGLWLGGTSLAQTNKTDAINNAKYAEILLEEKNEMFEEKIELEDKVIELENKIEEMENKSFFDKIKDLF